jgi:hypothetical protein
MNIRNRLKKMENQVIGNDSEFCDCEKGVRFIITPNADGKPLTEPPEFCATCGKPNAEPLHATFTISTKAELTGEA